MKLGKFRIRFSIDRQAVGVQVVAVLAALVATGLAALVATGLFAAGGLYYSAREIIICSLYNICLCLIGGNSVAAYFTYPAWRQQRRLRRQQRRGQK